MNDEDEEMRISLPFAVITNDFIVIWAIFVFQATSTAQNGYRHWCTMLVQDQGVVNKLGTAWATSQLGAIPGQSDISNIT